MAVSNGFYGGVAQSARVNKSIRQPSFVGASISEWVNQQLLTVPIPDDGVVQNWVDNFDAALVKRIQSLTRTRLSSPLDLYVSITGSDTTGDGLTPATAWATPQHAYDYIMAHIDMGGQGITVHMTDGTYSPWVCTGQPVGGQAGVAFVGDTQQPDNVLVSAVNDACVVANNSAVISVSGMKFQASGMPGPYAFVGSGLGASNGGWISFGNVDFGSCQYAHLFALEHGTLWSGGNPYMISAGGNAHAVSAASGTNIQLANSVVSIFNNPNFSMGFVDANTISTQALFGMTFNGAATGVRAVISSNAVLFINGQNVNSYLPGDQPASVTTGGIVL